MSICEITIHDISEYISFITAFRGVHAKLWFRGHPDVEYTLQPSVYRSPYTSKDEKTLLHQFKARGAHFVDSQLTKDIEWLFVMQHHATPTRLLDWSENALIALAFATQYRLNKHKGKDAAVWCLNPQELNKIVNIPNYNEEPIPNICENEILEGMLEESLVNYPIAIIGPQNTDRIVAQRGVFTLFPVAKSFSLESREHAEDFLTKITIPESSIKSISDDLYYIGMTESTIYPELDSISKELRRNYEGRKASYV